MLKTKQANATKTFSCKTDGLIDCGIITTAKVEQETGKY